MQEGDMRTAAQIIFRGYEMASALPSQMGYPCEEEMQARLAVGEKMHIEDYPYLSTIEKRGEKFWAESWPVPGVKLDPLACECETLAEALAWVIGRENITWK